MTKISAQELPLVADTEGVFSPAAADFVENPYSAYERLRAMGSLVWSPKLQSWLLPTFRGVDLFLKDKRFAAGRPRAESFFLLLSPAERERFAPLREALCRQALFSDGTDHARLRGSFAKSFTPAMVERLKPEVQRIAEAHVEAIASQTSFDLIRDVAYPLPVLVIGALLGVPDRDREKLKGWSDHIALFLGQPMRTVETCENAQRAVYEMQDYFRPLVAERRKSPQQDLLSLLLASLSDNEVLANAVLVLTAGHETTTNLIGNGVNALLATPGAWEACVSRHVDLGRVVEELLRFDSPVQMSSRVATEDVIFEGQTIREGQRVFMLIGSANRDAAVFADPDRLDVHRNPAPKHLSFGQGVHFCPGAMLSRLEALVVLELLTKRFPRLSRQSAPLVWRNQIALRGLTALPLKITSA